MGLQMSVIIDDIGAGYARIRIGTWTDGSLMSAGSGATSDT